MPASATLRAGREVPLQATFSIATSVVGSTGCSVISATYNGVTTRALLKLFSAGG